MGRIAVEQPAAPLLSVITPCRNAAGTLADTLVSVAAAAELLEIGGQRLEHWIVDGHSSDGTAALVAAHRQQHPWCVWLPGQGGGPYAGMAAGLAQARGHYVHVLNADDFVLDPEAYAQALLAAQLRAANFILASIVYVRRPQLRPLSRWRVQPLPPEAEHWHRQLRAGLHYPHPGFLAERQRYSSQGFDLAFRYAADYKAMQALLLAAEPSEVLLVPQPLVAMARGGATGTWAGRRAGAAELRQINKELGIRAPLWRRYAGKLVLRLGWR